MRPVNLALRSAGYHMMYALFALVLLGGMFSALLVLAQHEWISELWTAVLGWGLLMLSPLLLYDFSLKARRRCDASIQRARDKWVVRHRDSLLSGESHFFLYLRPFDSAGAIYVPQRAQALRAHRTTGYEGRTQIVWSDLEALIAGALAGAGPLVGVGRQDDNFGAARIKAARIRAARVVSADESWRELVLKLMHNAMAIYMLPSGQSGTTWELDRIVENPLLRAKTIFVIPGTSDQIASISSSATKRIYEIPTYGAIGDPEVNTIELRSAAIAKLRSLVSRDLISFT
jgi:hypothetical protein